MHATRRGSFPALCLAALAALAACSSSSSDPPDPYRYTPPPAAAPPAGLDPASWTTHLTADILPYWTTTAAQGSPVGNFPTWRGFDGTDQQAGRTRRPRMMGRQVFAYAAGFMMTGDEALLDLARAGNSWLLDHGQDTARGGWYPELDDAGNPAGSTDKLAQDMAYDAMGPAAFFFVTRDPAAEAAVLATRDLLFDPATYWDAANGRIRDGRTADLSAEVAMPGGSLDSWQLVAQLDPITAFELLVQPVLTAPARREQALGDLRTLAARLRDSFWRDDIFWGATGAIGIYRSDHTDFGHMLKAYWALLQVDKRLPDRPFAGFVAQYAGPTLRRAYDDVYGLWAKRPTSATTVEYGSDWWAYAEADQLAATLALHDPAWIATLGSTAPAFVSRYVDRTRPVREVVPSIQRNGAWYSWSDTNLGKCNDWKNGFHTTEHALVMYLFSHWLAGTPAPLHFAFPHGQAAALAAEARPYTFLGTVDHVENLGALAGDPSRDHVVIWFKELR